MTKAARILIVDDDASIRDAVSEYLRTHGFETQVAEDAMQMDRALGTDAFDLLILDLMMPGEDGLSVCRRLGGAGLPILILSALGETTDRVIGLEIGASDYLAKPFEPRELLARVRAQLRRGSNQVAPVQSTNRYQFEQWTVDCDRRALIDPSGREIILTAGDMSVLVSFLDRPGRVLTRDQLLDLARGREADAFDRSIDLAVSRLRSKLNPDGEALIATVRGKGYRFTAKVRR